MSDDQIARARDLIAAANQFSISHVVWRYCRDYRVTPSLGVCHEQELKRFLVLIAVNLEANYGMYGPVDDIWHTVVIFTKDYAAFCDRIAGRFMHHIPGGIDDGHLSQVGYRKLFADYETIFQEEPPVDVWPRLDDCDASKDCRGGCRGGCSGGCRVKG